MRSSKSEPIASCLRISNKKAERAVAVLKAIHNMLTISILGITIVRRHTALTLDVTDSFFNGLYIVSINSPYNNFTICFLQYV